MVMPVIAGLLLAALQVVTGSQVSVKPPINLRIALPPPTVLLMAPAVAADGSRHGPVVQLRDSAATWFVTSQADACDATISTDKPPSAREGWRVVARVTVHADRTATAYLEWQRLWTGGRELPNGASATTEVSLRLRDRVPIDTLPITAPGLECHGSSRILEVYVSANLLTTPPDVPTRSVTTPLRMEVWLVHRTPLDEETTYHMAIPFDPADTRFVFRTKPIPSPDGIYYVDIDGQFRAVSRADGSPGLWAGVRRSIVDVSTGTLRTSGGSSPTVAWASPGEVISFDLPVPGLSGGRGGGRGGRGSAGGGIANAGAGRISGGSRAMPLANHHLSLRVRFTVQ